MCHWLEWLLITFNRCAAQEINKWMLRDFSTMQIKHTCSACQVRPANTLQKLKLLGSGRLIYLTPPMGCCSNAHPAHACPHDLGEQCLSWGSNLRPDVALVPCQDWLPNTPQKLKLLGSERLIYLTQPTVEWTFLFLGFCGVFKQVCPMSRSWMCCGWQCAVHVNN